MALRLTLPGSKTQRRPAAGYALPSVPMPVPMPVPAPVAPPMQAQQPQPVSTGLDPAIAARAANKAGISDASINKLLTMIPELLQALSAPVEIVKTGDPNRPYRREMVRPQAADMTGQTSG